MMSDVRMAYQAPITPAGTTRPASAAAGLQACAAAHPARHVGGGGPTVT